VTIAEHLQFYFQSYLHCNSSFLTNATSPFCPDVYGLEFRGQLSMNIICIVFEFADFALRKVRLMMMFKIRVLSLVCVLLLAILSLYVLGFC